LRDQQVVDAAFISIQEKERFSWVRLDFLNKRDEKVYRAIRIQLHGNFAVVFRLQSLEITVCLCS
ncbi:MAG: hypothetical protein ACTSQ8_21170, partial [Candidatus Helarchaeota archaeon]